MEGIDTHGISFAFFARLGFEGEQGSISPALYRQLLRAQIP